MITESGWVVIGQRDGKPVAGVAAAVIVRAGRPFLLLHGGAGPQSVTGYGRAYAAAIPGARFQLLPATGHVPADRNPGQLRRAIWDFAGPHARHPID
jgi:pimeloyl-ACP methyl ester carboxylesterase